MVEESCRIQLSYILPHKRKEGKKKNIVILISGGSFASDGLAFALLGGFSSSRD